MLTGGHSHADSLSVTLFGAGKELLVDPGTFVYNCAGHWRRYFRSTAAHNTVTVDHQNQATMSGTFRWATGLPWRGTRRAGQSVDYVEGEHRGYESLGITHRRGVAQVPGGYWLVIDELRGVGEHDFDFNFHFGVAVDIDQVESDSVIVRSPDLFLAMYTSAPVTADLIKGWMSRGYGHKQAIQSLRATFRHAAPVYAATLLVPGPHRVEVRRLEVESGESIAFACAIDGVEESFRVVESETNLLESTLCAPSAAF